jgi:hypothetical protein
MSSFITVFSLLLLPILILLIVRVRRRQRIVYTHTFLLNLGDRRLKEFLLRTFQLYYDVAADLLLALLLALVLSGVLDLSPRRIAVCLDGSYSMTRGQPRSPLDRALALLSTGEMGFNRYRLFAAGFDSQNNRHRLYDLGRQGPKRQSVAAIKERLDSLPAFFSSDPKVAAELLQRGYRRVIYLTDSAAGSTSAMEVVEVGQEPGPFFYPLSTDYRDDEGSFGLRVLLQGFSDPIQIWYYDEGRDVYSLLQTIQPEPFSSPVAELRLKQEGLYKLSGGRLDFLVPLSRFTLPVRAEGQFSSLIAEILPGVQPDAEGILLADIPWRAGDPGSLRRAIGSRHGIMTLIPKSEEDIPQFLRPYIQPLLDSLSRPSYTELPEEIPRLERGKDRLFFMDPGRIQDAGTPLVYLSALWARRPQGPVLEPGATPSGAELSASRSGSTSFAYRSADRTWVVNLPPEEFFPIDRGDSYTLSKPTRQTLLVPILLMLLYLLKLLYLARLHGGAPAGNR